MPTAPSSQSGDSRKLPWLRCGLFFIFVARSAGERVQRLKEANGFNENVLRCADPVQRSVPLFQNLVACHKQKTRRGRFGGTFRINAKICRFRPGAYGWDSASLAGSRTRLLPKKDEKGVAHIPLCRYAVSSRFRPRKSTTTKLITEPLGGRIPMFSERCGLRLVGGLLDPLGHSGRPF